jgi:hypothetical protein
LMENKGKTTCYELFHYGNKEMFIFLGTPLSNLLYVFIYDRMVDVCCR